MAIGHAEHGRGGVGSVWSSPETAVVVLAALVVKTSQEGSHRPVEVWHQVYKDIFKSKVCSEEGFPPSLPSTGFVQARLHALGP